MPTFPKYDPSNLPPYPEKPHATGQARVNVDGKSQYLGKYGTVESHALYHLACARKLTTGLVPPTRELKAELSLVAGHNDSRGGVTRSLIVVVALVVFAATASGLLSHYLTMAAVGDVASRSVTTLKPVVANEREDSDVGDFKLDGDNHRTEVFTSLETSIAEMKKQYPDAVPLAVVEKVKAAMEQMLQEKSEGSQQHVTEAEGNSDSSDL